RRIPSLQRASRRPRRRPSPDVPRARDAHRALGRYWACMEGRRRKIPVPWSVLQGGLSGFSGADADRGAQITHENLAVADAAGLGGPGNRFEHTRHLSVLHGHFDFYLRDELDRILLPAVRFLVTFLTPESLDLGHRHALHADFQQRVLHFIEFERLDDRFDQLHWSPLEELAWSARNRRRRCMFSITNRRARCVG